MIRMVKDKTDKTVARKQMTKEMTERANWHGKSWRKSLNMT